jgi:hypothetical protein
MDEPPYTCETSEIMNKPDMGEIPETPAKEQGYGPLDAASCSAFTVREALQRCAKTDEGWARIYRLDAKKCEESDHPKIRERAAGLISRAEEYELAAARYRSALEWMES